MRTMTRKPVSQLTAKAQARKQFNDTELRLLGESLKVRQLQPVACDPEGVLLWGERRWRAAKLVGLKELDCIVTDEPLTESEVRLIQLTENIHRADLLPHEKWLACKELMELNPGWQQKDLAAHLYLDASMVTRILSPSRCIPAVQEAFIAGRLGISDCYAISKVSEKEQHEMLAAKFSGATRDQLEQTRQRKRSGTVPSARVNRVRVPLASGLSVMVAGESVSLEEFIDALGEAQKQAKAALKDNLDAKTWQQVMQRKAMAG